MLTYLTGECTHLGQKNVIISDFRAKSFVIQTFWYHFGQHDEILWVSFFLAVHKAQELKWNKNNSYVRTNQPHKRT